VQIAVGFWKIQRQIVGHETVVESHLAQRDLLVRVRHLLQILISRDQRIDVRLRGPLLQQMENDLCVFRIVLVPGVVQRLAGAGDGERRDESQLTDGLTQHVRQGPMVIAGRFERDFARMGNARISATSRSRSARVFATRMTRRLPFGSSSST
jgi:hypothetical protein